MKLLDERDDQPAGAPAWALSFGDLMSLLLIMFVMLASMSELRHSDKYQGVADSLGDQFGDRRHAGVGPGELKPRNPSLAARAVAGRAKRAEVIGSAREQASVALHFAPASSQLSPDDRRRLAQWLPREDQALEVRGTVVAGDWDVALERAQATVRQLTGDLQVDPRRVRLLVVGPDESIVSARADEAPQVEVWTVPRWDSPAGRMADRKQPLQGR